MKRTTAVINLSTIVMLSAILAVGNAVAFHYGGIIDLRFSKSEVNYDTDEVNQAMAEGKNLAMEIVQEGTVLLKNENNTLPLTQPKVNIFGWGASDNGFLYQGGGSSEGGYSGDKISFYQAFRDAGFQINEDLATAYNNLTYRYIGAPDQDQWSTYYRLYEADSSFYTKERMNQAKEFSDTAIVVLSRRATEGDDLPKCQYDQNGTEDDSRTYLTLSDREALLISEVTANFDKVIVCFNTSAPMEMGFLDYDGIDAALQIGYPGYYGARAVSDIFTGNTNPSGHMVDTAAYSVATAPSYVNTGNLESHTYSGRGGRYTDYAEGIYVGYRWYETADAEGYFNGQSLDSYGHQKVGYDAYVQYPFGYGLSYTDFSWEFLSASTENGELSSGSEIKKDDTLTFKVRVTNTGSLAGKDVVQLYFSAPYTKGGIEKSAVELGAFAKTALLEPGKSEDVTLTIPVSDLSSYDCYDSNNNGFMGYEAEKGNYTFSLRTDSHHLKDMGTSSASITFNIPEDIYFDKDPVTGYEVKNRFTTYTNTVSGASSTIEEPQATYAVSIDGNDADSQYDQGITYLSRADFTNAYPKDSSGRTSSKAFFTNVISKHDPIINSEDVMPTTSSTATSLTLDDVKGLDYDDPKWTQLIEQLSAEELANLSAGGGFGTIAISSINKPKCTDSDGGTGFTSSIAMGNGGHAVKYPAANVLGQTFNIEEAYKWGHSIGTEGKALNIQGWYAPGCNLHRSPLGGRNFEYFSEDPLVAGDFVAYTVKGATENGVYCYMKHFAGNDSDAGRNGQFKWMTEQSLRELYAKPGEIATKVGKANALMVSVDRVGSVRCTGSYALLTEVLRNEWGFRGSCITDYYQGGNVNDIDECVRAGCDLALYPNATYTIFDDYTSATSVIALQNAAHNILYTYIDTVNRTEKYTGTEFSHNTGTVTKESDGRWWRTLLISLDAVIGAGLVTWGVLSVVFAFVKKGKKKEKEA